MGPLMTRDIVINIFNFFDLYHSFGHSTSSPFPGCTLNFITGDPLSPIPQTTP